MSDILYAHPDSGSGEGGACLVQPSQQPSIIPAQSLAFGVPRLKLAHRLSPPLSDGSSREVLRRASPTLYTISVAIGLVPQCQGVLRREGLLHLPAITVSGG